MIMGGGQCMGRAWKGQANPPCPILAPSSRTLSLSTRKRATSGDCRRADMEDSPTSSPTLHRVLAQFLGADLLQPLLELVLVGRQGGEMDRLRLLHDRAQDENRRVGPQGPGDCSAGARVGGGRALF